jgi:hypothetical protein
VFVTAAILLAQEQQEVHIDPAEEGLKVITGMLIVGLIFISVIALGQFAKWASHRRKARRGSAY